MAKRDRYRDRIKLTQSTAGATRKTKPAIDKVKKKRLGFLDLPGEIRNMIYAYCFEDEVQVNMTPNAHHTLEEKKVQPRTWASAPARYERPKLANDNVSNNQGSNANRTAAVNNSAPLQLTIIDRGTAVLSILAAGNPRPPTHPEPRSIKYKPYRRRHNASPANPSEQPPATKWPTSVGALVLTNRQIHSEALSFFYATPLFTFETTNALLRFLALLPPHKLAYIRKLQIAHTTYGDPVNPRDDMWKARHERAWARAMGETARLLTGLQLLRCRVVANERPLVFGLGVGWAQALTKAWSAACQRTMTPEETRKKGGLEPLRVEIAVQSAWVVKGADMPNGHLRRALVELHRLFAEAVRRRLYGWSEEDAMVEYNLVKFDKYKRLSERYPMP
ncbi:hypothetical protein DBV05_g9791 [Lasiodiplodia theobromae]|uniref:F-box domain-containing protein n=1 Tax=Lasiodiplodia theobromae TaxID=45133 RepID=A0A5N5D2I2_9PEZI|nr:hypothetical protein DBV05_g9791 [Lasiodiplodia theobromae]